MKNNQKFLFILLNLGMAISCNPFESNNEKLDKEITIKRADTTSITAPNLIVEDSANSNCYEQKFGPIGRENIFKINFSENNNVITGLLEYLYYGEAPVAGSIVGKREKEGEIIVLYTYVQEGRAQYQRIYFKEEKGKLLQKSGELVEIKGVLDLKNKKGNYTDTFNRVPCNNSFL